MLLRKFCLIIVSIFSMSLAAQANECPPGDSTCYCNAKHDCTIGMSALHSRGLVYDGFVKGKFYICKFQALHCNNNSDLNNLSLKNTIAYSGTKITFINGNNKLSNNGLIVNTTEAKWNGFAFAGNLDNSNTSAECFVTIKCTLN